MDQSMSAGRTCPACGSAEYEFRSRKAIAPEPGRNEPAAVETKYRCKACGHLWRVLVPATGKTDAR
jgi:hypothetical protein